VPNELVTALGLAVGLVGASTATWKFTRRRLPQPLSTGAGSTGMWDVIRSWIEGKAQIALERERRATRLATLRQVSDLPPGASITEVSSPGVSMAIRVSTNRCQEEADSDHEGDPQ
jgi:hypothetical protein